MKNIHNIVEYIKQQDCAFTPEDVLEDVDSVLEAFGFCVSLTANERLTVIDELYEIAQANETREAERIVLHAASELGLLQPWYTQQVRHSAPDDAQFIAIAMLYTKASE